MRKIIFVVVLVYNSFEANGEDSLKGKIDSLFNTNKTDGTIITKSDGSQCECTPYYLCTNSTSITDNTGLIDFRGGEENECPSYLEVCCKLSAKKTRSVDPTPMPSKGCGYRNPGGFHFRVEENDEAEYGEFPWMVAILVEEFNIHTNSVVKLYKCGGSLLHPQAVLTAAHCVSKREKKYKIRAGEWDTRTTKELYPHQDRFVKNIVVHNEYVADGLFNDLAILFLDEPVTIGYTANTICLPEQDIAIPSGTKCIATGWGKDVSGKEGKYQVVLKRLDLPMVDRDSCQEQLRNTTLGDHFVLDKSFVCAGGESGKDTCKGDEGSPLACPIPGEKDRYQHVGIVSWGVGCGENHVPRAYVNVPMFRHWIDEQITEQKLDSSSYHY